MVFQKFLKIPHNFQNHHTDDPKVATNSSSQTLRASVPDNRYWDSYGDEEYVNVNKCAWEMWDFWTSWLGYLLEPMSPILITLLARPTNSTNWHEYNIKIILTSLDVGMDIQIGNLGYKVKNGHSNAAIDIVCLNILWQFLNHPKCEIVDCWSTEGMILGEGIWVGRWTFPCQRLAATKYSRNRVPIAGVNWSCQLQQVSGYQDATLRFWHSDAGVSAGGFDWICLHEDLKTCQWFGCLYNII